MNNFHQLKISRAPLLGLAKAIYYVLYCIVPPNLHPNPNLTLISIVFISVRFGR